MCELKKSKQKTLDIILCFSYIKTKTKTQTQVGHSLLEWVLLFQKFGPWLICNEGAECRVTLHPTFCTLIIGVAAPLGAKRSADLFG